MIKKWIRVDFPARNLFIRVEERELEYLFGSHPRRCADDISKARLISLPMRRERMVEKEEHKAPRYLKKVIIEELMNAYTIDITYYVPFPHNRTANQRHSFKTFKEILEKMAEFDVSDFK